jgi:hypothetical protein
MKRGLLAILMTILPLAAAAQENGGPAAADGAATASATPADVSSQPAPPPHPASKRRGSMVGYIEDPAVESQVRVRFDAGYDIDSPDRAEFFYAKCGCYRGLVGSPAYDPDAPGPGPGVVDGLNYSQFNVLAQYAFHRRLAVFGEVPIRSIRPIAFVPGTGSFDNQSGLGDVSVGAKVSLFSDEASDVTVMVRGSIPTGDSRKGLGTDAGSIEPALLFRRDAGERAGIEGQFGYWHPLSSAKGPFPGDGNFAGNIIYYGIGPSVDVVRTERAALSPVVELVGWHVLSGFQTSTLGTNGGDASGINIVNLKIGARVSWNRNSFYAGYGFPLTDNDWYGKIFRVEYRAGF